MALLSALSLTACLSDPVAWITVPLAENVHFDQSPQYRSDRIEVPIPANSDLEYMLDMQQGFALAYHWESADTPDPELLLAEFHGHTVRVTDAPGNVMFYKQGRGRSAQGYLVAPFDGAHGWYFSNETASDIKVILTLSGFYSIP
jgi:hypothetical protein